MLSLTLSPAGYAVGSQKSSSLSMMCCVVVSMRFVHPCSAARGISVGDDHLRAACLKGDMFLNQKFLSEKKKQSIEMRRETVIRSLILYLGEKDEELFEDCLEDSRSDVSNCILKILVVHVMAAICWSPEPWLPGTECSLLLTRHNAGNRRFALNT
ncbi:hypothetical protein PAMP_024751 [Pampus punctatissimus]